MANHVFTISDTIVQQDSAGRYSLNDLHLAAGGEKRHGPSYWLNLEQTRELLTEASTTGIPVVETREGNYGGTFVARELVYAYAMWISPKFHLQVIRAYDALMGFGTAAEFTHGLPVPQALGVGRRTQQLIDALQKAPNATVRRIQYSMLVNLLHLQGITPPALADLLATAAPTPPTDGRQGTLPGLTTATPA